MEKEKEAIISQETLKEVALHLQNFDLEGIKSIEIKGVKFYFDSKGNLKRKNPLRD